MRTQNVSEYMLVLAECPVVVAKEKLKLKCFAVNTG